MKEIENLTEAISLKTGLSKEEVRIKIASKQRELSGLVSEEGAAYIVANELGVKTRNRVLENVIKISDIKPDMKSVTVNGRISRITGPREFTTKNGVKSKVANLDIFDKTGGIRVVLWNMSDIKKVEDSVVKEGKIIQAKNAYVRQGLNGRLEVHLGNRGMLISNPDDVKEEDYPAQDGNFSKISAIGIGTSVNIIGEVTNIFGINEFERDGRKGKVGNLVINDGSNGIRLSLWNEQTELLKELKVGDILKIENAYSKEGMRGIELQANKSTRIQKNPEGVEIQKAAANRVKVSELQDGSTAEIRGAIVNIYGDNFVYEMCPKCNKKTSNGMCQKCGKVEPGKLVVVNAMIDDGTGIIRSTFFRKNAEKLLGMSTEEALNNGKVLLRKEQLLGKEIIVEGRVKRNEIMNRLEFTVSDIKNVEPVREAEVLLDRGEKNDTRG